MIFCFFVFVLIRSWGLDWKEGSRCGVGRCEVGSVGGQVEFRFGVDGLGGQGIRLGVGSLGGHGSRFGMDSARTVLFVVSHGKDWKGGTRCGVGNAMRPVESRHGVNSLGEQACRLGVDSLRSVCCVYFVCLLCCKGKNKSVFGGTCHSHIIFWLQRSKH